MVGLQYQRCQIKGFVGGGMSAVSCLKAFLLVLSLTPQSAPGSRLRVGIVGYEDFHGEYAQFEAIFSGIAERDPTMRFQLAVGSYGQVLHWLDRQQIDVGILTPGVFAQLLTRAGDRWRPRLCDYTATVQLPAARSSWAPAERRSDGVFDHYRSVCLVRKESRIASVDDVRRMADGGQLEFLFVHPLSVSGHVAPREALRRAKINVENMPVRFTYSHSQSIRMLADRDAVHERIAFVWDDAAGLDSAFAEGVQRLSFPVLDEMVIPHDVVVVRKGFRRAERFKELLLATGGEKRSYRFGDMEGWRERYGAVRGWLEKADGVSGWEDGERIALDEIGQMLLQYARSHPTPPRVALVLSGGGARCSYQVGAVSAIEEKLQQLRDDNPGHPIDIELVVGTSGGAMNALPFALGVAGSNEGRAALSDTWTELNQCEIICPPLLVRINMGLWFALLQTAAVIGVVRWLVRDENRRGWAFAGIYTSLSGIAVLVGYFAPPPWRLLGTNHVPHHIWLWFSFGVKAAAWSLLFIGLAALFMQIIRSRRGDHIRLPKRLTRAMLATGLLGLPLLQLITISAFEETLSLGGGMEHALANKFPRLINRYLESEGEPPLALESAGSSSQRLRQLSREIMERGLLRRDLVITGSCLDQTSQELPSDLYFYAPAVQKSDVEPYGERGLFLPAHPRILLDVIMGSGSIYPLFPARRIADVPRSGEEIELVDGGFAHNSPVEAAVMWGATHVILIDVMSQAQIPRGNLLQNATSSMRHLHRQAQLLDVRSREKVTVFTLSPEPPHICIIDFASNLIEESIERGYRDASLHGTGITPRFRKELGEPVFCDVRRQGLPRDSH